MKRLFLILSVVFFTFGFNIDNTNTTKNRDNLLKITSPDGWGEWTQTSCLSKLDFRVKRRHYNEYAKKYYWDVQYRNRYNRKIHFGSSAVPYSERNAYIKTKIRKHVAPNETTETYFLVADASSIYVYISKIRFGKKDIGKYAECDK